MTEFNWIQMMEYLEDIRLFSSLYIKKTQKDTQCSAQEVDALFRIFLAKSPMTPLALSRQMGSSKSIVSRLLSQLCEKGLAEKHFGQSDRRSYTLIITESGTQKLEQVCTYYLTPLYELRRSIGELDFSHFMSLIASANRRVTEKKEPDAV